VPDADSTLLRLPEGCSDTEGVLLGDNFTTGYFCASRGIADFADAGSARPVAVVLGCGAVGLSSLVCARHLGVAALLAVDPVESRRAAALRMGADAAVTPDDAAAALASIRSAAVGADVGADVVLEAVGSRGSRTLALRLAAPGATVSSVGVATDDFGFTPADLYDGNLTWRVGRCPVRSLVSVVLDALVNGLRIPVEELAPEPPQPLENGPAAYERFATRKKGGLKPLLAP
jgi:threonine dehydrogenase-like Zn-dependent dehydrogenase